MSNSFYQMAAQQVSIGSSAALGDFTQRTSSMSSIGAIAGPKRGRFRGPALQGSAQVILREDNQGFLSFEYIPASTMGLESSASLSRRIAARRSYRAFGFGEGNIVGSGPAPSIGPNQVVAALQLLDLKLTPDQGIRRLKNAALGKPNEGLEDVKNANRVLLLIHGTFSHGDMFSQALLSFQKGSAFVQWIQGKYSHVLSFDHPTLSESPFVNAVTLDSRLRALGLKETVPIDVICHSRGGLVAQWWLRYTRFKAAKIVMVGSPLQGTSLASPYNLRLFLDYIANMTKALSESAGQLAKFPSFASGFLAAASGLTGILGNVTSLASKLPIADIGVSLVPGLFSQSRTTNNTEKDALWAAQYPASTQLYAIRSNFEPAKVQHWLSLSEWLNRAKWGIADSTVDKLFPRENDLVVDTDSMEPPFSTGANIEPALSDQFLFSPSQAVHHCIYFEQPKSIELFEDWLSRP